MESVQDVKDRYIHKTLINNIKIVIVSILCLILIACKNNKPEKVLTLDEAEKLAERYYSNRFEDNKNNYLSKSILININDSVISVTIGKSDTLIKKKYAEFHRYIAEDDSFKFTVMYNPKKKSQAILHPKTSRRMNPNERKQVIILVIATKDTFGLELETVLGFNNSILLDLDGNYMQEYSLMDSVYLVYLSSFSIHGPLLINERKNSLFQDNTKCYIFKKIFINKDKIELKGLSFYDHIFHQLFDLLSFINVFEVKNKDSLIGFSEKNQKTKLAEYSYTIQYKHSVTQEIIEELAKIGNNLGINKIDKIKLD